MRAVSEVRLYATRAHFAVGERFAEVDGVGDARHKCLPQDQAVYRTSAGGHARSGRLRKTPHVLQAKSLTINVEGGHTHTRLATRRLETQIQPQLSLSEKLSMRGRTCGKTCGKM